MKRKLSFLLLLILVPQMLFASSSESLKNIMDDYNYSMTVEWDQRDMAFANQKRIEFVTQLNSLVASGLTKDDIVAATGLNLDVIQHEIEILNLRNTEDLVQFLIQHKEFKTGANWVGDVVLATVFFTPIIVMIGMMIYGSVHRAERLDSINACLVANPNNQDLCFDLI
jgi:hypothetical protein